MTTARSYPYTVWTWVTGQWTLILGTTNAAAAEQLKRGFEAAGYRSDFQRAYVGGRAIIASDVTLKLGHRGKIYLYGTCPTLSAARDGTLALNALFTDASAFASTGTHNLTERQLATLLEHYQYNT